MSNKANKNGKPSAPKTKEEVLRDNQNLAIAQLQRPQADFVEVPTWDDKSMFQITGQEFKVLYEFYQSYSPILQAIERIFNRGVGKGLVSPVYIKEDGTHATEEEVKAFQEKMMEYIQKVQQIRGEKPPKPTILGPNGEAAEVEPDTEEIPEEKPAE